MTYLRLLATIGLLCMGCSSAASNSQGSAQHQLVSLKLRVINAKLAPHGYGGTPGLIWSNASGNRIFVEDHTKGPGDYYVITEGAGVKVVPRAGRHAVFFDDQGEVVAWHDRKRGTYLANGNPLPLLVPRAHVRFDNSGQYFYAYDWDARRGYVARLAEPTQDLFWFSEYPYRIWRHGESIMVACSSSTGNSLKETPYFRYQQVDGRWQRVSQFQAPGEIAAADTTSSRIVVESMVMVEAFRVLHLYQPERRKISGRLSGRPVFLHTDWFR